MARRQTPTKLIGPRVVLRHPAARDKRELFELRRQNRGFLERWEPLGPGGRPNFGMGAIERFLKNANNDSHCKFIICLRETGEIIGQVSLNNIVRGAMQGCSMGYWIARPFARMGLMTEAVGLVLAHAFVTMKLHRVEANIVPRNKPSQALAKRCGFRLEGVAKRYLQINGKWEDHQHWAMTAEEWRKRQRRQCNAKTNAAARK